MSHPFRALAEFDLPTPAAAPSGFSADPKQVREWAAHLPMANPSVARQLIEQALSALSALRCSPADRLEVLEALRAPVNELVPALWQNLRNSPVPLPPSALASMGMLRSLYSLRALGYRQVVVDWCGPAGKLPMLRGGRVGLALRRACADLTQVLRASWLGYRSPPSGTWLALHRLHAFARASALETAREEREGDESCAMSYRGCLLAAATNPYALNQAEQGTAWDALRPFAMRLPLLTAAVDDSAIAFEAEVDSAPHGSTPGEPALDPSPLLEYLRVQADGAHSELPAALARRLLKGLDSLAPRESERLPAGHVLDTVLGLGAVHFQLSGGLDFETFLQAAASRQQHSASNERWTARGDLSWAVPLPAQVLDQSACGYRLLWRAEAQAKIRVGEVVLMSLAQDRGDPRGWILGLIRWLRVEELGGVSAGVELIGLRARSLALQAGQRRSPPVRALAFSRSGNGVGGLLLAAAAAPDLADVKWQALAADPAWIEGGDTHLQASLAGMRECERPGDNILYLLTCAEAPASHV